jgi:hypothetical protein
MIVVVNEDRTDASAHDSGMESAPEPIPAEIFDRGASLVLALINFPEWIHRKVDRFLYLPENEAVGACPLTAPRHH